MNAPRPEAGETVHSNFALIFIGLLCAIRKRSGGLSGDIRDGIPVLKWRAVAIKKKRVAVFLAIADSMAAVALAADVA